MESVARDQSDRVILTMTAKGYTVEEIGAALMMSHQAVSKRLRAMRERYHAQQGEGAQR